MSSTLAKQPTTISIEAAADILVAAQIINSVDDGASVTHEINHPDVGHAFVISSALNHCTLIPA